MMYRYFIGRQSNLDKLTENTPIVIAADDLTSKLLNEWLESHMLDFDELIDCIKSIFKTEVRAISRESAKDFMIFFKDEAVAIMELVEDKSPKIILSSNGNSFNCNLSEKHVLEKIYEEVGEFKIETTYLPFSQRTLINCGSVSMSIVFDGEDRTLHEKIKETISEYDAAKDIYEIFEWIVKLTKNIHSFVFTIAETNVPNFQIFDVFSGSIRKYTFMDDEARIFEINENQNWNVAIGKTTITYDKEIGYAKVRYVKNDPGFLLSKMREVMFEIQDIIIQMQKLVEDLNVLLELS